MHIDLNAFFARAEEIRHPNYEGKPIVVGGSGARGVVSTASYAARKFGIHSGMPLFQARRACPDALFCPVDFPYYEMLSRSFRAYLGRYSSLVEPASIDECYVDLTRQLYRSADPIPYLKALQDGLLREIGLKSSIGLAATKFLAKMGSDYKKPMGITIVRKKDIDALFGPLPIESFWGIGKKTSSRLRELGIRTIGSLKESLLRAESGTLKVLGSFAPTCLLWLKGGGDDVVRSESEEAKSISRSITLGSDSDDDGLILDKLKEMSGEIAIALLSERKKARTVTMTLRDPSFRTHSRSLTLEKGISTSQEIYEQGKGLYESSFAGWTARLVGLGVSGLFDPREETVQMSFFDYPEFEKMDATKLLVNEFNRRLKKGGKLMLAREAKKNGTE